MSGPQRCVKTGPPKPAPAVPPRVEVLPATDRASFVEPLELAEIRGRFNDGDYRGCVEPIEALFFARRNTLHQGLLQYVVALHQLGLGLVRTPRRLLLQALEYWEPYPEWQEGLDLAVLRSHARSLVERLPADLHSVPPEEGGTLRGDSPRM
jgi:hypothetical protein